MFMMSDKDDGIDRIDGVLAAGGFGGGGGDAEADDDEHGDAEDLAESLEDFPHDQASRLRRGLGVTPRISASSGVGAALEVSLRPTMCCGGSGTMLAVAVGGADVWKGVMESAVCAQGFFGCHARGFINSDSFCEAIFFRPAVFFSSHKRKASAMI